MSLIKAFKNTPEIVEQLPLMHVFVFGSNTEGRHASGSAKTAIEKFGAKYGEPMGLQGKSYAIITKDFKTYPYNLDKMYKFIAYQIKLLYMFASYRPEIVFVVTKIGCGLAGFTTEAIAKLFKSLAQERPDNIILPIEFE